jgi:tetratricopeptide (TPR) repeat protein
MGSAEIKQRARALAESGKFDEALSQCDLLMTQTGEAQADSRRLRAYIYILKGEYEAAVGEREALIATGEGSLRDYYQLGENLLAIERFQEASQRLRQVLRLGDEQRETWFESAALLLLSYAEMQLGHIEEASRYLDGAVAKDADCALPVRGRLITHHWLRQEIESRRGARQR